MPRRSNSRDAARAHLRALSAASSAVERFLNTPSHQALKALVDHLHRAEASNHASIGRAAPSPAPLACGPGCTPCCHQNVAVLPVEVLVIANHLRSNLPLERVAELSGRVDEVARHIRGTDCGERFLLRQPCPLLAGDRCLVYPRRPLACRGDHSLDAPACHAAFLGGSPEPAPSYEPYRAIAAGLLWGTIDTLEEAGLEAGPLELTQALAVALLEDATERWLRGERLFAGAEWVE